MCYMVSITITATVVTLFTLLGTQHIQVHGLSTTKTYNSAWRILMATESLGEALNSQVEKMTSTGCYYLALYLATPVLTQRAHGQNSHDGRNLRLCMGQLPGLLLTKADLPNVVLKHVNCQSLQKLTLSLGKVSLLKESSQSLHGKFIAFNSLRNQGGRQQFTFTETYNILCRSLLSLFIVPQNYYVKCSQSV